MIKEGFIYLSRNDPKPINFPTYYLPLETDNLEELGTTISSMQELHEIPWPDDQCIIFSDDHMSNLLPDSPIKLLNMMIHDKAITQRYNAMPRTGDIELIDPIAMYIVVYSHRSKRIHVTPSQTTMFRTNWASPQINMDTEMETFRQISVGLGKPMQKGFKDHMVRYWKSTAPRDPSKGGWFATLQGEKQVHQFGLAADVLGYLSNIALPCNYILKSKFSQGFGPTGAMRRIMAEKPIFSVVSGHRIYRELVAPGETDVARCPHFRRGHIRHHWKEADINRFLLPRDPIDRMRLVTEKKVRRSYVPPTWVGVGVWEQADVKHEIVSDEIPLRNLK